MSIFQRNIRAVPAKIRWLIVTVTVNPSIDRNVAADRLVFEDRAHILARSESAGGRGINASAVIHAFGGQTLAIAPAGGKNGKRLEAHLATLGFPFELVRIKQEIRSNLTISDKSGLTVKLNEFGPAMDAAELGRLERAVRARLNGAHCLMLCGSLPPGVPAEFYARLIRGARKRGVRTFLDTEGDALLVGAEAGPSVVAPNQQEAERLLNRALITRNHFHEAVERINALGAESVILSLGSRGALGMHAGKKVAVTPPRVEAVCPIGSGDALAAAFTWAISSGKDFSESLRWAVAAGTASAMQPGLSFASLAQTEEMFPRVTVGESV